MNDIAVDDKLSPKNVFKRTTKKPSVEISDFDLSTCYIESVSESNVAILHNLIDSQAKAHKTVVRSPDQEIDSESIADRTSTEKALLSDNPEEKILDGFIFYTKSGEPAGFVTTSYSHTSEGRVLYLEDIHALPEFQGYGVGAVMYRAVQVQAWVNGCHAVPCTVDDGLKKTNAWYEKQGAARHGYPVLGMDDFTILNSSKNPGSVIVLSRDDLEHDDVSSLVDGERNISIDQNDIAAMDLTGVQIHNTHLNPNSVREITSEDIDNLEIQLKESHCTPTVGRHDVDREVFVSALRDAVDHKRNFCVASFNQATGKTENVSFIKVSFSTFNNVERLNVGSTVSLTKKIPNQNAVLNHIAFCQNHDVGGDRIEVQLDPVVVENSQLSKLFNVCKSRMTEENDTDEYTRSKTIDPPALKAWVEKQTSSLRNSLFQFIGVKKLQNAMRSIANSNVMVSKVS